MNGAGEEGQDRERPRDPWWASGARPGDDFERPDDPLSAHRSARRGERRTFDDAYDILEEATRIVREGVERVGAGRGGAQRHEPGSVDACRICPVCAVIRIVGDSRPELVEHLSEAARHLTLAAKVFVDAQAEALGGRDRLERIEIDEE